MKVVSSLKYVDSPEAQNRYALVTLDPDMGSAWEVILNGTDENGDYVTPRFLAIDNYNNPDAITVTIGSLATSVGPFTKTVWQLSLFETAVTFGISDYSVNVWISEQKLPIGEGVNQFGKDTMAERVAFAANRAALAALDTSAFQSAYLSEAPRNGIFTWSANDNSANVTGDPFQGIYIPGSTDASGKSGAWVRDLNDIAPNIAMWGASVTLADSGPNIQAAINWCNANNGGELVFPAGVFTHSGLQFKNNIVYRGKGSNPAANTGTVLKYSGNSDGVHVDNPVNGSTPANYHVHHICFFNTNNTPNKGCFADTCSSLFSLNHCGFYGSDRGLILDQSETCEIYKPDFGGTGTQTCLVWLVNGNYRNVGAQGGFTNSIRIRSANFNGPVTCIGIADDGGTDHQFTDCNFNGLSNQIRAVGCVNLYIKAYGESAKLNNLVLAGTDLAGNAVGQCSNVRLDECILLNAQPSVAPVSIVGVGTLVITGGYFYRYDVNPQIIGAHNAFSIVCLGASGGNATGTGTPMFDGKATVHFEVGGAQGSINTNAPLLESGNQVVGVRGASLGADATDLASVISLANAIKARIKTTGGHGLVAD